MKNSNLMIINQLVKDVNIDSFTSATEMNEWEMLVYPAIDKEQPGNKFNNLADIFGQEFSDKWYAKRKIFIDDEMKKIREVVEVDGKEYKAKHIFDVMHCGWESDETGWIVEENGENKIVLSNHGENYFAKKEELESLIKTYQETINQTQVALDFLK